MTKDPHDPANETPKETPEAPAAADTAEEQAPAAEDALQAQLEAAEKQRDEYLDLAQHVQAEFENYRRRTNAVRAEAYDDGARAFIKTVLPVVDNLERAVEAGGDAEALKTGVELVMKQLKEALEKRGVEAIDRPGEKFDPQLEDAVVQGTAEEGAPGTVCQVLQKGYKLGQFVLRHAMVKVVPDNN